MPNSIDYFFTSVSPFAYLGHDALLEISLRHGCKVNFRPFNLGGVWASSGAVPLPQRPAVRQRYRLIELQRFAEYRGIDLNLAPAHFPVDPTLADHCAIAVSESGADPAGFVRTVCEAVWTRDLNIADMGVLADLLAAAGLESSAILAKADSDAIAEIRDENTKAAVAFDAIGAPSYVYKGEVFWGQDRLDYLDRMIATGRDAFTSG
jgi:2-hydroxychromene-2-carboxylate isomerase